MKKWSILTVLALALLIGPAAGADAEESTMYAKANLKIIKGKLITWVNWQSTPTFIPVGTEIKVSYSGGKKAKLIDTYTDREYTLDIGAAGEEYLHKFVTDEKPSLDGFATHVSDNIKRAVIKVGMTKEEAYMAMGPPANADGLKTNTMTYEQIIKSDLWVYKRKRFGKNIGIQFDRATGKVSRTEGIWGQ
jgi:hypothetical protein